MIVPIEDASNGNPAHFEIHMPAKIVHGLQHHALFFLCLVSLLRMRHVEKLLVVYEFLPLFLLLEQAEINLSLHGQTLVAHGLFKKNVLHISFRNIALNSQTF